MGVKELVMCLASLTVFAFPLVASAGEMWTLAPKGKTKIPYCKKLNISFSEPRIQKAFCEAFAQCKLTVEYDKYKNEIWTLTTERGIDMFFSHIATCEKVVTLSNERRLGTAPKKGFAPVPLRQPIPEI